MKATNKLIAQYMGVEFNKYGDKCNHPLVKAPWPPIECLQYHCNWSWLMLVIEKIINDDIAYPRTFGMISEKGQMMFRFEQHSLFQADTLIEAAYLAVVDLLERIDRYSQADEE